MKYKAMAEEYEKNTVPYLLNEIKEKDKTYSENIDKLQSDYVNTEGGLIWFISRSSYKHPTRRSQMSDKSIFVDDLYEIELSHHKREARESRKIMAKILSDDFIEFQSSGGIINKQQALEALEASTEYYNYELSDFENKLLTDTYALNTFASTGISDSGEKLNKSHRSSLWRNENGKWRLLFHQGTRTKL